MSAAFKDRLNRLLADSGISQAELARRIGLSRASVSDLMSGQTKQAKGANLIKIAAVFGASPAWLATGKGPVYESNVRDADKPKGRVPVISMVQAGRWKEIVDIHPPGHAEQHVETEGRVSKSAFALVVEGDSMEDEFPEGCTIVVEPERQARSGDYVVAKLTDTEQATFKRLRIDGGRYFLQPLNKQYQVIEIDDPARIIGVVIERISRKRYG